MKFDIKLITDWRFLIPAIVGLVSLGWSIFNFVVGKLTFAKILGNDLKHVTDDIGKLEKENKLIKIDLKKDLEKIFRRLGKIDKGLAVRTAICNERHSKDKK